MPAAMLTISSRNYSSWSLRGWLLCRMAGLDFEEDVVPVDEPSARAELLLLSPSVLVPRLTHGKINVWDTLAIAEYLNEAKPEANLWPADPVARAHARAISGEMHSGFANLRSALPMNLKAHYPGFKVWAGAQGDIERVIAIWRDCLATYGGPYLFGALSAADVTPLPSPVRHARPPSPRSWPVPKPAIAAVRRGRRQSRQPPAVHSSLFETDPGRMAGGDRENGLRASRPEPRCGD